MFRDRQRVDLYIRKRPSIVLVLFLIYLIVMVIGVMIPDLVARREHPVANQSATPTGARP
jgi:hypothetical protein